MELNYYKIFVMSKDEKYFEVHEKYCPNKQDAINWFLDEYSLESSELNELDNDSDWDFEVEQRDEYQSYHDISDEDLVVAIEDHGRLR